MSLIEVKKVEKTYGDGESKFDALKGVSLKIEKGESVAIVGKSGSGKSTLMHILALLDKPTSGEILIDGKNTNNLKKREVNELRNKTFGFVFQQFFMNPKDSVLNNVLLPLKIAGVPRSKRKPMAEKALRAVELTNKINNKANDLSGGQKQRVCIARAIVNNPKIIFADEPTGNLDSQTAVEIMKLFGDIHAQGNTVILVTHEEDIAAYAHRVIRLRDGLIETDTTK